ncbi:unnamed protein product [Heligmosomoides polygyrus]|uniref:Uncharacterized protein n=1 Tax=Heligmosomoides polygyrus TaxID=6339 RepID=A0A183G3L9_HELPZ|nr:unnamed protein product [Heligmosomoides polygyrus]
MNFQICWVDGGEETIPSSGLHAERETRTLELDVVEGRSTSRSVFIQWRCLIRGGRVSGSLAAFIRLCVSLPITPVSNAIPRPRTDTRHTPHLTATDVDVGNRGSSRSHLLQRCRARLVGGRSVFGRRLAVPARNVAPRYDCS